MLLRNGLRTAGRRLIRRRVIQRASSNKEGLHKSPITEALWKQRMKEKEMWEAQDSIDKNALPPQTTLQSKVPRDSAVRVQYAFTADGELRDRYTNCWGAMDKGIIFEDLDALAGNVAWRHAIMGNGTDVRPPILVTAAVDEVRLRGSLKPDSDIYMTGRVIFVGSSSMLVRCEVGHTSGGTPEGAAVDDSSTRGSCDEEPLLCADFLYVARDAVTGKASKVNRLEVFGNAAADDRDRALFEEKQAAAEAQKRARQMDAASRLALDQAMKSDARALLKQSQALLRMPCLAATRNVSVLVGQTKLQNTMICQPQQRNTSGRIFGG
jgi:acyl-coenzyme A thioesterase 9